MTTIDDVMLLAREVGDIERRRRIGKAQGFDVRDAYAELRAAIEQYARGIGEVVVTKTPDGQIAAVTRQDEDGRVLSVVAEPVAYIVDEHCSGEPQLCFPDECVDWQKAQDRKIEFVPLYTRPSRPLTKFQRMQIIGEDFPLALVEPIVIQKIDSVVRRTERAHGITE
jgi:hypothetical protein